MASRRCTRGGVASACGVGGYARQDVAGGSGKVTVVTNGVIDASGHGVFALNGSNGGVSVTQNAAITGKADYGIVAETLGAAGDVTVIANAAIGSGANHVGAAGIYARNATGTGAINVDASAIWADGDGVIALQGGGGASYVRAHGDVVSTNAAKGAAGIRSDSQGGYTRVLAYGDINAAQNGVVITSTSGKIAINTTAGKTIIATAGDGLYGHSGSGDIVVLSAAALIADPGINTSTGGSGAINVYSMAPSTANNGCIITSTQDGRNNVFVKGVIEGDHDNNGTGDAVHATASGKGAVFVHAYAGGEIVGP